MSGSAAAKQLRQKHKKVSPTKRKQFTFRKTRTQELADIRRASQKKVIQKLSQSFSHFSIDEEDATYTATPTTAETDAQLGLMDAIVEPPSSDHAQKKAKEANGPMEGATEVEEGTKEKTQEETQEEIKEGTTEETKEGTTGETNKDTNEDTNENTKEGTTNKTTDNTTDDTTDDSETKKDTDPSDPTTKETTEDETSEAPTTAPVLGTRKDTEATTRSEGEEAHQETKNTTTKKKVMTGFMSNMTSGMSKGLSRLGSMFGGKKKKEKKIWKAVPGALPAGAKDVEYWNQLVAHYHKVLETKNNLPQNQSVVASNNTNNNDDDESGGVASAAVVPPIGSSVFWAHFNLAMAHDCRGRPREAIPHYKQALDARPDNVGLRVRACPFVFSNTGSPCGGVFQSRLHHAVLPR